MKRTEHLIFFKSCFLCMLALGALRLGAANPPPAQTTDPNSFASIEQAKQIIGQDLKTQDGKSFGKVQDIVVDLESGRILYALVSASGKDHALPLDRIRRTV